MIKYFQLFSEVSVQWRAYPNFLTILIYLTCNNHEKKNLEGGGGGKSVKLFNLKRYR